MPDALSKTIPIWQVAIVDILLLPDLQADRSMDMNQVHCDQSSSIATQPGAVNGRMEYRALYPTQHRVGPGKESDRRAD